MFKEGTLQYIVLSMAKYCDERLKSADECVILTGIVGRIGGKKGFMLMTGGGIFDVPAGIYRDASPVP